MTSIGGILPAILLDCLHNMPSPLDVPEQPTPAEPSHVEDTATGSVTDDQPPQPLAIEFGETSKATSDPQNEPLQTLDLGEGDVIKLDSLGPIIINNDGVSLRRVCEWPPEAVWRG